MKPGKPDDRKPAETPRDPDLAGATAAMHRAARRARRRAAENGTLIPVFEDGKVVWVKVYVRERMARLEGLREAIGMRARAAAE